VLEIKVISRPTPIWGGVKGILINKNFNGSTLLLTSSDGVTTCLIVISTNITMAQTSKWRGINFKLVFPLIGLASLVVRTGYSSWLD
jgi:hypothetical protein